MIKQLIEKAKIVGSVDLSRYKRVVKFDRPSGSGDGTQVSQQDLNSLEKVLDRLFAHYKIDITFTKHFKDRLNDARNKKQITIAELRALFQKAHDKAGKRLTNMKGMEAVLIDLQSKINVPFILKVDKKGEMELVSKTVMRKANFMTRDAKIKVENMDGKSFESFVEETENLVENLEAKDYMKAARKARILLDRDLRKLFPDQDVGVVLQYSTGDYLEAYVYAHPRRDSHNRMMARACARFELFLSNDEGQQVPMKKFKWMKFQIKTRTNKTVPYKDIVADNPLKASLELLKWFKTNKETFTM